MVEVPSYIRLVAPQGQKRTLGTSRPNPANASPAGERNANTTTLVPVEGDSVALRASRDLGAGQESSDFANPYLAGRALSDLQRDLPALGQGIHDLHAGLNRGRVLGLLAPLVENDPIAY